MKNSLGKRANFEEFLKRISLETHETTRFLRHLILSNFPFLREEGKICTLVYWTDRKIGFITPIKNSVNLMFLRGEELEDKYNTLQGGNFSTRYVEIKNISKIDENAILDLFQQAINLKKKKSVLKS